MITSLPPGFSNCGARFQQRPQIVQFTVYEDSESLKGSGRRMNLRSPVSLTGPRLISPLQVAQ